MKILQIGLSKNYGGIESFVMSYFRELVKKDVIFDFVDIYGDGLAYSDEILSHGGKIYTLPNYKKHPVKAKKLMTEIIKDGGYGCVHINMLSAANILPLKATLKAGNVPIVHSHNSNTEGFLRGMMHKINLKRLRKLAAIKLSCGQVAGEWLFGNDEFLVVPNAVDTMVFAYDKDKRKQIRDSLNVSDETLLLGFAGRLTGQKNPLYLLDILERTKSRAGRCVKLLIVGDGELKADLLRKAEERGLSDYVITVGRQTPVAPWYSAMDAFLLPSLYEGFVIVGVEAQANGLPCYMSDKVSKEIKLTDAVDFLSIDGDASNWAESILCDIGDAERGKPYLKGTIYDITVSADRLKSIYEKVCHEGTFAQ